MSLPLLNYFANGEWVDPPEDGTRLEVLAADSFVLDNGDIVGFPRHRERFFAAVVDAGVDDTEAFDDFVERCLLWFPREGRWFPRLDVVTNGDATWFRYHHRLAPAESQTTTLAIAPADTREVPWRKGPDLERMAALRASVSHLADEALILADDKVVVEGAYSAIVVIDSDAGQFCLTPSKYPRIDSITEQIVSECVRDDHFEVIKRSHTLSELEGKEVWVLSALHGIRVARALSRGREVEVSLAHRGHFQELRRGHN